MKRIGFFVLGLGALWLAAGCAGKAPVLAATTNSRAATEPSAWPGFGEPGPGKIKVKVDGGVKHPGIYYLKANATMSEAVEAARSTEVRIVGRLTRHKEGPGDEVLVYKVEKRDANRFTLQDGDWLFMNGVPY